MALIEHTGGAMQTHHDINTQRPSSRCDELITETTRLRLAIEEREQYPGHKAQQEAARLWVQYHRAMVELLVMRHPHDNDAKARQIKTAQQHQANVHLWTGVVERLEKEVTP